MSAEDRGAFLSGALSLTFCLALYVVLGLLIFKDRLGIAFAAHGLAFPRAPGEFFGLEFAGLALLMIALAWLPVFYPALIPLREAPGEAAG